MVQINIVTSIATVALLLAPVISMPVPVETLRDINALQSRQFGFVTALSEIGRAGGSAAKSIPIESVGKVATKSDSAAAKMIKSERKTNDHDDKHHHDPNHGKPKPVQSYLIGGITMGTKRKRDIRQMEERSWNYI